MASKKHKIDKQIIEVGVISDTHGPLEEQAAEALKGVDFIVHAGDIMDSSVLFFLRQIAPTIAVRGNMDGYNISKDLDRTAMLDLGDTLIYVLHDLYQLDLDPKAAGISVVVHGHTHAPEIEEKDGVLYLNPGSAGSPRYNLRPTVARLTISGSGIAPKIVELD